LDGDHFGRELQIAPSDGIGGRGTARTVGGAGVPRSPL
jgi:hypothetical protein